MLLATFRQFLTFGNLEKKLLFRPVRLEIWMAAIHALIRNSEQSEKKQRKINKTNPPLQ
jgi:hypothetical protein